MIPAPRFTRLDGHKYRNPEIELLKMASFYGANGAGKSNLIRALELLQTIVLSGDIPSSLALQRMKHFHSVEEPTLLGVEFIINKKAYVYAIEIGKSSILKEELYFSGLGKRDDELIFERTSEEGGKSTLLLSDKVMKSDEGMVLKQILERNLIKHNKSALKILVTLNNELFSETEDAYQWFKHKMKIISPTTKNGALAHLLDIDKGFHQYAEENVSSFGVGIKRLRPIKKPIAQFFGDDNRTQTDTLIDMVEESPQSIVTLLDNEGEEAVVVKENEQIIVKQLKTEHIAKDGRSVLFNLSEESDGSIRLLDYLPMFRDLLSSDVTYFVDEIERSIHPLLIKELLSKFSSDNTTAGQLIFTTHESNLLDQEIFRQDEIWFIEKDHSGSSDLYSLCDFKEHNTKDIRRGYLSGRYGSIPFLANLKDLNWDRYDFKK